MRITKTMRIDGIGRIQSISTEMGTRTRVWCVVWVTGGGEESKRVEVSRSELDRERMYESIGSAE